MADKLFRKKIKLGTKRNDEVPVQTKKKKMYYPSMYIDDTELPLEGEDVGKTFTAQIKLKVTGVNQRTGEKGTNLDYRFDVMEIAFGEGK